MAEATERICSACDEPVSSDCPYDHSPQAVLAQIEDTCRSLTMLSRRNNAQYALKTGERSTIGVDDYIRLFVEEMDVFCRQARVRRTPRDRVRGYRLAVAAATDPLEAPPIKTPGDSL